MHPQNKKVRCLTPSGLVLGLPHDMCSNFGFSALLISYAEAKIIIILKHIQQIAQHFLDGINYVEDMLRKQLISAIGKEIGPQDFHDYMRYTKTLRHQQPSAHVEVETRKSQHTGYCLSAPRGFPWCLVKFHFY